MLIGNKIRELRKKLNYTQTELSKVLGVTTGAVGLWELNKREPDFNTLVKLSKLFKVTIDYLLDNETNNTITIIGRNGTHKKYTMNDEQLKALESLAETMCKKDD